jgi:glycine oxidase
MNIGVAGAGLMGRLLAWQLLRRGHQVTLFDRDSVDARKSAARIAAAMLAPYSEVVTGEQEVFEFGRDALARWPDLLRELNEDSDVDVYFQRRGSVVVAHPHDRGNLDHFAQLLKRYVPNHLDRVFTLDQNRLLELEPELASVFTGGLFLEEEGTLDNRELLQALEIAIKRRGGAWKTGVDVKRVEAGALHLHQEVFRCDLAIDTRGLGARLQLADLRGVRGEVLWVYAPEVNLSRPVRLMHPRYQLYIAPKRDHVYVIGATQIESESLAPITVRSSLELQSALYSVHTGFAEAEVLDAFANCRPAFLDNLPRVETSAGLLRVNGLYRHGYLLSPIALDLALRCAEGCGEQLHPWVQAMSTDTVE